jgi:hypothetical protein
MDRPQQSAQAREPGDLKTVLAPHSLAQRGLDFSQVIVALLALLVSTLARLDLITPTCSSYWARSLCPPARA